ELTVLAGVALLGEPLVEHQVVLFRVQGELAPNDQRPAAIRRSATDSAEPERATDLLLEATFEAQPLLTVALEGGAEGLRRGKVTDSETDQPVERLQQIDVDFAALVRARPPNREPVGRRISERLHVEQRLATARLHVEHVAQHVLLLEPI